MREIRKKVLTEYFEQIEKGQKTFELRLADWQCSNGDILILDEIDPETKQYTGRSLRRKVGYVLHTRDVNLFSQDAVEEYGYQIISLLPESAE